MDLDDIFKLDFKSLEYLSRIALAVSLWEQPDVKKLISSGFFGGKDFNYNPDELNFHYLKDKKPKISSGQKVVHYVFKILDSINIPEDLLHDIKICVVNIGQKIFYWRQYVNDVLKLNVKYAEKIFWTSCGQIDELRILKEYWLVDTTLPNMSQCKCFMGGNSLYCFASMYGQENYVKTHLKSMKNLIISNLDAAYKKQKWTPYAVIATWFCFYTSGKKPAAVKYFKSFKMPPDQLPAKDLMLKCISKSHEFGAKYFWSKLSEYEKLHSVTQAAEESLVLGIDYLAPYGNDIGIGTAYEKEIAIRLFLFFINQMTEIEKTEFVIKNTIAIFRLCIRIWPYQELCEKIVFQMWDPTSSNHGTSFLNLITNNLIMRGTDMPDYFTTAMFYKKMLQFVLPKVSKDVKVPRLVCSEYATFHDLYQVFDSDNLALLLTDPDLKDDKDKILSIGQKYFKKLLLKKKYKAINKFMKKMKFSDEEVKSFKQKLNLLHELLIMGDVTGADELLNWLSDSEEERNELKNQVDASDISLFFVQNLKFVGVKNFLSWKFNTEEERIKVLEPLKSEDFLKRKIFEVWSGNDESDNKKFCEEKCSKLLKWAFGSKEKIEEFKKAKLVEDKFLIEKYWDALYDKKTLKNLDLFLQFCSMTSDEINAMKINIANDINWWIDTYAYEKTQYFGMVEALLNWVYGKNKKEKRSAIKKYMKSCRGTLLFLKMCKNSDDKSPVHILKFFNSWIKPSFNFKEFEARLDRCDESVVERKIIPCIKSVLKIREDNKLVKSTDLEEHITFESFCNRGHCDSCEECYNPHQNGTWCEEHQEYEMEEDKRSGSTDDGED